MKNEPVYNWCDYELLILVGTVKLIYKEKLKLFLGLVGKVRKNIT